MGKKADAPNSELATVNEYGQKKFWRTVASREMTIPGKDRLSSELRVPLELASPFRQMVPATPVSGNADND
jgi:hypothetical protein